VPTDTALLIVDVQLGMFDVSNPVYSGDEVLKIIGDLATRARAADMPVIYIQHTGGKDHLLNPDGPGWPIHPAIAPSEGEIVVNKRHPDSFQGTNLQHELDRLGITKLVIAGIQTEYCIDTTCRRAYSLGYDVTLVQDAHTTWDTEHLRATQIIAHHNQVLGSWFTKIEPAGAILNRI
jgi:nicotinamidase-related amidase